MEMRFDLARWQDTFSNSSIVTWAESFIFAGSSALLLLITNLFPEYLNIGIFLSLP